MENEKGLSPQVRKYLADLGKTKDEIDALAANMAGKAQAAQDAGIESKDVTPEAPATDATTEPQPDTPTFVTAQEVADNVMALMQPVLDTVNNLTAQFAALQSDVKALKETDAAKIAQKTNATPRASLQELLATRLLGKALSDETEVKGPKQAEDATPAITGVSYIDQMIAQSRAAGVKQ